MPQVPVFTPDGDAIRARRLRLGLSASQLGRKLGRGPQTIHQIETGQQERVSDLLIHQIANALDAEVNELIKGETAA